MASTSMTPTAIGSSPSSSSLPPLDSSSSSSGPTSSVYECSLSSSDVDLSLRDDLTASVQDYLMRIVDELQQLSKWTSICDRRLSHSEKLHAQHALDAEKQQSRHHVPMLFVQTEMELVRRDIQLASQDVFQRATTQLAYVQNSFRSEYDDQLADLQRRFDDKLRFFTHKTVALLETAQAETQAKVIGMETALQRLQQQLCSEQSRLDKLEAAVHESLPALTATQAKQLSELNATQRRLDNLESSVSLQVTELKTSMGDTLQALRASQTQLATKLQIVRLDMQEQSEDLSRKVLQLHRFLSRVPNASGAGSLMLTGVSGEPLALSLPSTVALSLPKPTAGTGVKVAVGASAIARACSGDCFLHAKAALPPRDQTKRPSSGNSSGSNLPPSPQPTSSLGGNVTFGGSTAKTETPQSIDGAMDQALNIQSSTLSQPVGRENVAAYTSEATRPLSATTASGLTASPRKSSLRSQTQPVVIPTSPVLRPRAPSPCSAPHRDSLKQR